MFIETNMKNIVILYKILNNRDLGFGPIYYY
jgi:hypothetical protein